MFRKILPIIFTIIFFGTAFAYSQNVYQPFDKQRLKTILPSQTRFVFSLSGNWQASYDDKTWETVYIPSSLNTEQQVTLTRTIKIDRDILDKYTWYLYFLGVDDQVQVYLNDQFVGRYFSGMIPIKVQAPRAMLTAQTNTIKLIISQSTHGAAKIKKQNIFAKKIYTGVLREILLVGAPNVWISDFKHKISFADDFSSARLKATINISASDIDRLFKSGLVQDSTFTPGLQKMTLNIESMLRRRSDGAIVAASTPERATIEQERTITRHFNLNVEFPELWSPKNPQLYDMVFKISKNGQYIDSIVSEIAFRETKIRKINGKPHLYVNGKPFKMKGIIYVEDSDSLRQTLTAEQMEFDILTMKKLGANVVRFKFSPPHPYIAYLCDKYGLFMMIDLSLYEAPSDIISMNEIKVRMDNIVNRLIAAYDNYPSTLAWGLYDGINESSPEAQAFSDNIVRMFNKSTNLLYKNVIFGAKEIHTKGFDFIGLYDYKKNMDFDDFENEITRMRELADGKPVYVIAGVPIQPKNHNGFSDKLSIESQSFYIRNAYHIIRDGVFLGSMIDCYADYKLNNPILVSNNEDQYVYSAGLITGDRKQRASFNMIQALFNDEDEPLLNAGSYKEQSPISFIVVGVVLGLALLIMLNRYRRFREYIFRSALRPYNFYADIRDQRIMSSIQTVFLGLIISLTLGAYLSSIFYFYKTNELLQYCLMLIAPVQFVKEGLYRIIWSPELIMALVSLVFFILIFVAAVVIRLFAFLPRARIYFNDTFTITVWSGIPFLILLPVAIVLIRLLYISDLVLWASLILFFAMLLWSALRILRASSVIFDVVSLKAYFIGAAFVVVILGAVLAYYHYEYSIFAYAEYMFDVLMKS